MRAAAIFRRLMALAGLGARPAKPLGQRNDVGEQAQRIVEALGWSNLMLSEVYLQVVGKPKPRI